MSRLSVPDLAADPSGQVYAQIKKAIGSVPNPFAAIAAHGPAECKQGPLTPPLFAILPVGHGLELTLEACEQPLATR